MKRITLLLVVALTVSLAAQTKRKTVKKREPGQYVVFETSMGKIVCRLFEKEAPKAVSNFIALAEGKQLYNGTFFHRVFPNFMIQAGHPAANETRQPGYFFKDEINPALTFDRPGRLAMANRGEQFFITEAPSPHLNGKHAIFGQVVEGQELVGKIAHAGNNKTTLDKVTVERTK